MAPRASGLSRCRLDIPACLLHLNSMYLDYYGLAEHPFNVTPDPRFICWTGQHREALDHLLYGVYHRKGFITLSGEIGTGKTTLCRACLSQLGDTVDTALILNPLLSETQLLRAMVNDFGIPSNGDDLLSCTETLNRYLLEQNRMGRNVVLFIDEAQNLATTALEQIRLLSNLETDRSKLIQIILCGQPEMEQRLNEPGLRQLRQRIAVRFRLGPLDERDTARYIGHRLAVAAGGNVPDVAFNESALWLVYAHSKGHPRLINAVADNALLAGYVERRRVINEHCVRMGIEQLEGERP